MCFAVDTLPGACKMVMWQAMPRESAISPSDKNNVTEDLNEEKVQTPVGVPRFPARDPVTVNRLYNVGQASIYFVVSHSDASERNTLLEL